MMNLKQIRWKCGFMARGLLRFLRAPQRQAIEKNDNFKPAVIVPIFGGLGNQIWQYAVGALVSYCSGLPVKYDLMWNYGPFMDIRNETHRNFELSHLFPYLDLNEANKEESVLYRRYFWREPKYQCVFEEQLCFSKQARYLGGFCANARYMTSLPQGFWNQFKLKLELGYDTPKAIEQIGALNSAAIHIRRGDYAGSIHEVVTQQYYRRAVEFLRKTCAEEPCFFVFSDDLNWAAKILNDIDCNFIYVNQGDSAISDFFMMTRCRHYVMANSTFSWMAAWLGKRSESVVVMPDRWFNEKAPRHIFHGNEKAFYVEGYTIIPC